MSAGGLIRIRHPHSAVQCLQPGAAVPVQGTLCMAPTAPSYAVAVAANSWVHCPHTPCSPPYPLFFSGQSGGPPSHLHGVVPLSVFFPSPYQVRYSLPRPLLYSPRQATIHPHNGTRHRIAIIYPTLAIIHCTSIYCLLGFQTPTYRPCDIAFGTARAFRPSRRKPARARTVAPNRTTTGQ